MPIAKTANAAFKDYRTAGGTLSFTQWLHREKEKMYYSTGENENLLLVNPVMNDSVQNAIKNTLKQGGLKTEESGKTIFGINKKVLIGSGIVIAAAIVFVIVKQAKKVKS